MILVLSSSGVEIGFISEMDENKILREVRMTIRNEHGITNFSFSIFGVQISQTQENIYTLKQITTVSQKQGFSKQMVIDIITTTSSIPTPTLQTPTTSTSTPAIKEITTPTGEEIVKDYQPSSNFQKAISDSKVTPKSVNTTLEPKTLDYVEKRPIRKNVLTSPEAAPTTNKRHGQVLFSVDDIEFSDGLFEKERMRHYNAIVEKIQSDHRFNDWGIQARDGLVDTIWTKKKSTLLEIEIESTILKLENLCELNQEDESKVKTIKNKLGGSMDAFAKVKADVELNYFILSQEVKKDKSKRQLLEKEFNEQFSLLKQAQANSVKSLECAALLMKEINAKGQKEDLHNNLVAQDLSCEEVAQLNMEVDLEDDEIEGTSDVFSEHLMFFLLKKCKLL